MQQYKKSCIHYVWYLLELMVSPFWYSCALSTVFPLSSPSLPAIPHSTIDVYQLEVRHFDFDGRSVVAIRWQP
jgi:hypothetical protein